ncbi:hypothetical protein Hanom_Chr13g01209051 [Helianthus anomalus]
MASLALMKRRIACLIDSNLVKGLPLTLVFFISKSDSGSTSIQKSMSSDASRDGGSVYRAAAAVELCGSLPSMVRE